MSNWNIDEEFCPGPTERSDIIVKIDGVEYEATGAYFTSSGGAFLSTSYPSYHGMVLESGDSITLTNIKYQISEN